MVVWLVSCYPKMLAILFVFFISNHCIANRDANTTNRQSREIKLNKMIVTKAFTILLAILSGTCNHPLSASPPPSILLSLTYRPLVPAVAHQRSDVTGHTEGRSSRARGAVGDPRDLSSGVPQLRGARGTETGTAVERGTRYKIKALRQAMCYFSCHYPNHSRTSVT